MFIEFFSTEIRIREWLIARGKTNYGKVVSIDNQ